MKSSASPLSALEAGARLNRSRQTSLPRSNWGSRGVGAAGSSAGGGSRGKGRTLVQGQAWV